MHKEIIEIDLEKKNIIHRLHKDLGKYFFSLRAKKNMSLKQLSLNSGIKEERLDNLEIGRGNRFDQSGIIGLFRLHQIKAYIVLCRNDKFK